MHPDRQDFTSKLRRCHIAWTPQLDTVSHSMAQFTTVAQLESVATWFGCHSVSDPRISPASANNALPSPRSPFNTASRTVVVYVWVQLEGSLRRFDQAHAVASKEPSVMMTNMN